MAPPFRTDQIGSLLRPSFLLEARSSASSSSHMYDVHSDPAIKEAEKQAILQVIAKQLQLGIRPVVSGEYCRHVFYGGFFETLSGMTAIPDLPIPHAFRTDFPTTTGLAAMGAKTRAAVKCTGPIRWTKSAYLEEWEMISEGLGHDEKLYREAKITMPAPTYQHIQLKPGTAFTPESGYTTDLQYFQALAEAYVQEISALYSAGCRNIQIDDPHLTYFCSSQFLQGCAKDGTDTDELLDLYLESHNLFLGKLPKDLRMGMHLCRGNMSGSKHWVTGSYDKIAEKLFTKTNYDTFYLEFDDLERSGGFECLKLLPKGKNVVLGLISTKKAELEDEEDVARKIYAAAEATKDGLEGLALSPQCGFSSLSVAGGKGMSEERMWEKLELVRKVAGKVWGDDV
ncbi:hypothetical protein AC579_9901 [Pseudocercospora musae]|uniref:Cobalamin-independent methionine synthase MetE C-terminal/archaeal domain-containing protein n=1 Tax=Pseudocercospora musae TaxID=113226 RepID=A0A139IFQ6_9PEZI|nr:hypothetical protein AC579_9901 [Pseudocercospora musae]